MKKLRLLLLDANVIIKLFELGLWDPVVEGCEVLVSRIVVDEEASFYVREYSRRSIDLSTYEASGQITVVDVSASEVDALLERMDSTYIEKMDPGEAESLAYLVTSQELCLICSSDKIVFRVLGLLFLGEQGISLEEVLHNIGRDRPLDYEFTKRFREFWTRQGGTDGIYTHGGSR